MGPMRPITPFFHDDMECTNTILLCDSDPKSKELAILLRERGCQVLEASDDSELIRLLSSNPAYIVADPEKIEKLDLCGLTEPDTAPGLIAWTNSDDPFLRNRLFQCGLLDFLSKSDTVEETAAELIHLFQTIENNSLYHITLISPDMDAHERFKRLTHHRNYRKCLLTHLDDAKQKWTHQDHELPDLLVLDLTDKHHFHETFDLIHYIRIHRLSEIPVVVLIRENDINIVSKLYRAGVHDVIQTPCSAEEFLNTITHHLDYRISKKLLKQEQSLSCQLKAMIDSGSIVSKTDPSGIITYVNEEFCRISGYNAEELLGRPHNIIRHPDNSPLLFKQMWQTIQNKKMFHGMIMNRRKDGSTYYVDTTIAPILDDNDAIIEYISIRHDVTPLIEKQHEIEEKRRQIQNVLNAQTSLICMVDKIHGIRQSNKGFLDFLGISSLNPDVSGFHYLHELFLDIDDALHIKHGERYVWLDRLYEMRGKFVKVAMQDRYHNHHIFAIHVEKIPDPKFSEGICYLVSFENVTELNRALREAKEASEAESRFLATMSHEIRTPLNGILGFAELLSETPLNNEQRKYLQAIEYSGDTLRQIINDILEVMKLEREEIELSDEPLQINSEIEAILYPFYAQAAKKGVDLLVFIDPKLPATVYADPLRIKQVLINLVNNAIKFTQSGKRVYVRVKRISAVNGEITIGFTVADEGIGVKPEHRERIFKAFVQADNSIAREYGGTGLGLNIVARITAAKGGKLSFKSIYGKGSVFHTQLVFHSDMEKNLYACPKGKVYLYLPAAAPSPRFLLVERYLKQFECGEQGMFRTAELDMVEDKEENTLFLFSDLMGMSELSHIATRFQRTRIFIVPSFSSTAECTQLNRINMVCLQSELSWSGLCREMHLNPLNHFTPATSKPGIHFKGLRILVAEDNEVNRFYIQEVLKKLGIAFEVAHDGYEAVKKFINSRFDMVLMDINMPNLDGITATQQILRYERETEAVHTPIIGLSADAVAKNITRYISQGLDGYLIKPLQKSELVKTLEELFLPDSAPSEGEQEAEMEQKVHNELKTDHNLARMVSEKLELPIEIIYELFRKFINNAENLLRQLQPDESTEQIKNALHSLKGIAKNLYIEPLGTMCEQFEKNLSALNEDSKREYLQRIQDETLHTIRRMQQELAR